MNEEKPHKSHTAVWVYSILAVLLVYVLASGPTHALVWKYYPDPFSSTHRWWGKCYMPLDRIPYTTPMAHWLGRYIAWWDEACGEPVY